VRHPLPLCVAAAVALVVGLFVPAAGATAAERGVPDLAADVDPMIGTIPVGFTVPGAAVPFGMVQNSPDTTGQFAYTGYSWTDAVIRGFSLVHLNGPGVPKGGDLPFLPMIGAPQSDSPNVFGSTYDHVTEQASPGRYRVVLHKGAIGVDLTASTHTAMQRYTFPPSPLSTVMVDVTRSAEGVHAGEWRRTGPAEIEGTARGRYAVHFVARFDHPITSSGPNWVRFDTTSARAVTMKAGVSFVDIAGARRNLDAEAPGWDFAGMARAARNAWNDALATVRVKGGTRTARRSLYTALYHAYQHPNVEMDVDRRYLGMDGAPHTATDHVHYANFSSWDTYKAQNQLLAALQPARYRDMLLSLLDAANESGKLPRWGEHNFDASHMSGDPAIPMIADGVCRGLFAAGDTRLTAFYNAMVDLTHRRPAELTALGYLPVDRFGSGAGTTLEYGVADFALALVADRMGNAAGTATALAGSERWKKLLDPTTGWIRPRNSDGSWLTPFDPTEQTGFQEGNSWQYSWLVPHDGAAVVSAMGGPAFTNDRLDTFFRLPPEVQNRLTAFGLVYRFNQFAPGNEHDLEAPFFYALTGRPAEVGAELARVRSIYRTTPDGLPGNDDLGSLSAWHVWSSIGISPFTPGAPLYVIGRPAFDSVRLGDGTTITTRGNGRYVTGARLNGSRLARSWVPATPGQRLELRLGDRATWRAAPPPSASVDDLSAFGCR
jgi:putative alpha-1,2-mannosidase